MRIALIPARGGSKRIPGKNIKPFHGKPIMAWPIEAARASGCFDRIIVSTDDDQIAELARSLGAETPFVRPADLSNDRAGTLPVVQHALEWLRKAGAAVDYACCIYATAPFIRSEDLRAGFAALQSSEAPFCFAVTSYAFPVQRALRLNAQGRIEMLLPEHANTRSQELEEIFHDAGQFYWGTASAWASGRPVYLSNAVSLKLPRLRVQDIDTDEDWERAEWLFKHLQEVQD